MTTVSQPAYFNLQALDSLGALGVGMRLYTYAQGTTTHKTAYTDAAGTVPFTYTSDGAGGQYIAMDARGELPAPLYLTSGAYDLALKTSAGATVWTRRAESASSDTTVYTPAGTGAVATDVQTKLRESVSVKDKGAVGDGVTDDTAAIQAALDAATGEVIVPPGQYLCSGKLTYPLTAGVSLVGQGVTRESANDYPCVILFSHTGSPAVHIRDSGQMLKGLVIRATGARASASLDAVSFGVLTESVDASGGSVANSNIENVFIEGHPSHGYVSSGGNFMPLLDGIAVRNCKGHAFIYDRGDITSRANTARPGGIVARHLRTYANGGHDFVLGNLDDYGAYRVKIDDADFSSRQGTADPITASIKMADATCIFHGENIVLTNIAYSGEVNGTATYAAFQFSGRTHRYISNRFIKCVGLANAVLGTVVSTTTDDIVFDGVYPANNTTASPAISITGAIGTIVVMCQMDAGAGIATLSNWFTTGYVKGFILTSSALKLGSREVDATSIVLTGETVSALSISRADAEAGMLITRTGSGAATGKLSATGGTLALATTSDNNLVLTRNSVARLTVKASTFNLASLPTSAAGLSSGDLWSNSGVVTVVS
jgi:hypothetical protein